MHLQPVDFPQRGQKHTLENWIKALNVRSENMKALEENRENFSRY
jgi:hypothetical protein